MECKQCGICCRLFMINLSEEEYKSGRYKTLFWELGKEGKTDDFNEAEQCGANILAQNEDESCIYLQDGKCSIHNKRPQSCRNFFCSSDNPQFKDMIRKISEYKQKNNLNSNKNNQ